MVLCKYCGEEKLIVKNGIVASKQRYLCKYCGKTFRQGDNREKHHIVQKIRVLKLYKQGIKIREIARMENISGAIIIHWIKNIGQIMRMQLCITQIPNNYRKLNIIGTNTLEQIDGPTYGIMWTNAGIRLII